MALSKIDVANMVTGAVKVPPDISALTSYASVVPVENKVCPSATDKALVC